MPTRCRQQNETVHFLMNHPIITVLVPGSVKNLRSRVNGYRPILAALSQGL